MPPRPRYAEDVIEAAITSGMTHREFEATFGLSNALFYKHRRRVLGVPSSRKPSPDPGELRRLANAGCTPKQVADLMGYARRTIQRHARALEIVWRWQPKRDRAEWALWEDPQPGRHGVVPRDVFADIYRERGFAGTVEYLGLGRNAVCERVARMRAEGIL